MKVITLLAALGIFAGTCFAGRTEAERAAYNQRREQYLNKQTVNVPKRKAKSQESSASAHSTVPERSVSLTPDSRRSNDSSYRSVRSIDPFSSDADSDYSDSNAYQSLDCFSEADVHPEHESLMNMWQECRDDTDATMMWDSLSKKEKAIIALYSKEAQKLLYTEKIIQKHESFLQWWRTSELKFLWWSVLSSEEQSAVSLVETTEVYKITAYTDQDYEDVYNLLVNWENFSAKKRVKQWAQISEWEQLVIKENAAYYEAVNDDQTHKSPSESPEPELP